MRTKIISILAVVALYFFAYIWCWNNVPFGKEETGLQTLAGIGLGVFGSFGLILTLYHTIMWLLKGGK